jgi:hypothetical protein
MSVPRPDSPLGRIAAQQFYYCSSCKCTDCNNALERTFCPKCICQDCKPRDGSYIPDQDDDEDDRRRAFGKRKQIPPLSSPQKRVKVDSLNTTIKNRVSDAATSAANSPSNPSPPVPPNVVRFCLISLGHSPEDCLQTCHIVPRALSEDHVRHFPSSVKRVLTWVFTSSRNSSSLGVFSTMASIFIPGTT